MTAVSEGCAEVPIFFESEGHHLFGVVTHPTGAPCGVGAVLLWGAGGTASALGRNDFIVKLARRLASRGYHALRFDYHGQGESSGPSDELRLDRPFVADGLAAADALRTRGPERLLLMGTCFGARTALAAAAAMEQLDGVVLFPPPVREFDRNRQFATRPLRWYVRRLLSIQGLKRALTRQMWGRSRTVIRQRTAQLRHGRSHDARRERFQWVSDTFLGQLAALVDRGVPVLIVYGRHDGFYQEWIEGQRGPLGALLRRAGEGITVVVLDDKVHGMHRLGTQTEVLNVIQDWLARDRRPTSAAAEISG